MPNSPQQPPSQAHDLYLLKLPEQRDIFSQSLSRLFLLTLLPASPDQITREEFDLRLDAFILKIAEEYGGRVFYWDEALDVIVDRWRQEPEAGRKWNELSKIVERHIAHKLRPVTDIKLIQFKHRAPAELDELHRLLKKTKAASVRWDLGLHLANARSIVEQLAQNPKSFPVLTTSGSSLLSFFQSKPEIFAQWLEGPMTNKSLMNEWGAAAYGYKDGEYFRQAVSELARKTREKAISKKRMASA